MGLIDVTDSASPHPEYISDGNPDGTELQTHIQSTDKTAINQLLSEMQIGKSLEIMSGDVFVNCNVASMTINQNYMGHISIDAKLVITDIQNLKGETI